MNRFNQYISYVDPRQNMRGFVIAILSLAVLGIAAGSVFVDRSADEDTDAQNKIFTERFSSPNVFVYAYWAGDKSEVKSFDLETGEETPLASLPLNVKHVRLIAPNKIMYINETNEHDYGSQIVVKQIPDGEERIVVVAAEGMGIDDYRVSPSGQYIATWEVSPNQETGQLFGGTSQVYSADINTGVKNLIYGEVANVPVHYPVAITDNGEIYMDTFLPNDSPGYGYGMSVSNFDGSVKEDLTGMSGGTYGSQPVLSPDGTKLAFVGYDGSKGNGMDTIQVVDVLSRRAIISANTVDVFDLTTRTRQRLANLSSDNGYSMAWWDELTGNVLFSMLSKNNAEETGTYSYNLPTGLFEKIDEGKLNEGGIYKVLGVLSPGNVLMGSVTADVSTLGNLGSQYEQSIDATYVVSNREDDVIRLNTTGGFIQPISVKPSSYFGSSVASFAGDSTTDTGGVKERDQEKLQLQTFTIKPTLAPQRIEQQSSNRCRDVAAAACNELLGTSYTGDDALKAKTNYSNTGYDPRFEACIDQQWSAATAASCYDSPLYLYGERGMAVNVKVGTPVIESRAPYSPLEGYSGVLTGDGGIEIDGAVYPSLEYDYEITGKFAPPAKGAVINRTTIDDQLKEYAEKLGMNDIETYDFIKYVKANTSSESFFLSHFSHTVSSKLLPLHFTPQPDSYTNIIFYIDEGRRDFGNVEENNFEKIKRNGYTAVEVSYIVRH